MAGGTGGHIFPGLAVAQALRARGWQVVLAGRQPAARQTQHGKPLMPRHGFAFETLDFSGVRGKGVADAGAAATAPAARVLAEHPHRARTAPQVVVGLGGYITFPAGMMACCWASRWSCTSRTRSPAWPTGCWPASPTGSSPRFPDVLPKARWVGNPLRDNFLAHPAPEERFAGRSGPLRVLVVGGSLGARVLNDTVPQALARIPEDQRPQVTHQSGATRSTHCAPRTPLPACTATLTPFIDDTAQAFADADLVICRAGASTVTEIAAIGAAALFVPIPTPWTTTRRATPASWSTRAPAGWCRRPN
jgi:UDP-N-acetylglucosamine--N-acetylmuramyl-(pentapeptide) pyrophosphoryl-undecaprenol N-acetylglucosamine transferase